MSCENTARCPGNQTRLLLVETDAALRGSHAGMLAGAGFVVDQAADGEEGWAAMLANPYHLVIADHLMPKASGRALARRMRVAGMAQPVLLMAGPPFLDYNSTDPWQRIDAVITKPFTACELLNHVECALRLNSRHPFGESSPSELHAVH